jgi:hypothetical protein
LPRGAEVEVEVEAEADAAPAGKVTKEASPVPQ